MRKGFSSRLIYANDIGDQLDGDFVPEYLLDGGASADIVAWFLVDIPNTTTGVITVKYQVKILFDV
jgi:hypothetical protein